MITETTATGGPSPKIPDQHHGAWWRIYGALVACGQWSQFKGFMLSEGVLHTVRYHERLRAGADPAATETSRLWARAAFRVLGYQLPESDKQPDRALLELLEDNA